MASPLPSTTFMNLSVSMLMLRPGMLSSLSRVPPVKPRPRPLILATLTPHAASSGTSTRLVVSPTPPVECLSTFTPEMGDRSSMSPDCAISMVRSTVSRALMPFMAMAISMAEIW